MQRERQRAGAQRGLEDPGAEAARGVHQQLTGADGPRPAPAPTPGRGARRPARSAATRSERASTSAGSTRGTSGRSSAALRREASETPEAATGRCPARRRAAASAGADPAGADDRREPRGTVLGACGTRGVGGGGAPAGCGWCSGCGRSGRARGRSGCGRSGSVRGRARCGPSGRVRGRARPVRKPVRPVRRRGVVNVHGVAFRMRSGPLIRAGTGRDHAMLSPARGPLRGTVRKGPAHQGGGTGGRLRPPGPPAPPAISGAAPDLLGAPLAVRGTAPVVRGTAPVVRGTAPVVRGEASVIRRAAPVAGRGPPAQLLSRLLAGHPPGPQDLGLVHAGRRGLRYPLGHEPPDVHRVLLSDAHALDAAPAPGPDARRLTRDVNQRGVD